MSSADYRELKTKVQAPLEIARDVMIHLTLDEKFVEAFVDHVRTNPRCVLDPDVKQAGAFVKMRLLATKVVQVKDLDACIGCMRETADVKLQKYCADHEQERLQDEEDRRPTCGRCYCKPMW